MTQLISVIYCFWSQSNTCIKISFLIITNYKYFFNISLLIYYNKLRCKMNYELPDEHSYQLTTLVVKKKQSITLRP